MKRIRPQLRRGVTLIELLIVLPIIVVAGFVITQIMFQSWQAYQYSLAQAQASDTFVRTLDRMSRVIRSSSKVISASNNDLTLETYYSPRDASPDRTRYYLSSSQVKADVIPASGTAPNYTYPAGNSKTYNISQALNTASQPVFRYYDENGTLLTSPYDVNAIRKVEITLTINPQPKFMKINQTSSTQVQLRNMKTNL